jgi:hypothetical protein
LHARYRHAAALPLYQMIGKNVGIWPARGRFVLATNIDILFFSELAAFLAEGRLDAGRMYRIDRHDLMKDVPVEGGPEEQLEYCRNHLIRVNRRQGTFGVSPEGNPVLSAPDVASQESGLLFGEGWFPVERYGGRAAFRWAGKSAELLLPRRPSPGATLVPEMAPGAAGLDLEIAAAGQAAARVSIQHRSRVFVRADWAAVDSLRFSVNGALLPVYSDPRPLAFRLFAAGWEESRGRPIHPGAVSADVSRRRRTSISWGAVHYGLGKIAQARPVATFTVFVPPGIRRMVNRLHGSIAPAAAEPEPASVEPPVFLHTNACGDFTLLARERWFELRGYPEFDLFSMNLDSVFCYAAHHGGAPEEVLADPMRIYHIEHGTGSGWTPEGQNALFRRIAALGLSYVDNDTVLQWAQQMRRLNAPMIFNREDWGLAEWDLPESVIQAVLTGTDR